MNHHWPLPQPDPVLDEAVDIAVDYLEGIDQTLAGGCTRYILAEAILDAWLQGCRHKIRLANAGIAAVQKARAQNALKNEIGSWFSVFPRVSF